MMDAQRFFNVSYDSRNHPKVRMLRMMGGGIVEYGRYVALLGILYDMGNRVYVGDGSDPLGNATAALLADELDVGTLDELRAWLGMAAECGLISGEALAELGIVASNSVGDQLVYREKKAEAGRTGGRPRKKADS